MINKENFIMYMDRIKNLRTIEENINEAGRKIDLFISFAEHEQLVVDILRDSFDDQEEWISYFVYELDFGAKWHPMCITANGIDVPMSNAGELYDVLERSLL